MIKDNLLRIKINGRGLIKLTKQHQGRDFLLSYPTAFQNGVSVDSHFSLHTPNNCVTFKVTSFKDGGVEQLPATIAQLKNHPTLSNRVAGKNLDQLDIYKNQQFDFSDPLKLTYVTTMALNMEGTSLEKYFNKAKTANSAFVQVKDIQIPKEKNDKVTIKLYVGKNFRGDFKDLTSKAQEYVISKEVSFSGDEYTFLFLFIFDFPQIKKTIPRN
ncbi:MAG: hypothetical protein A2172_02505 [Candidatus Woykebacteria bacterium RBG_13_40_15]|uniref:Uncharacterized protein n=1 Tax=Candidatus Woykebacteria bacterium RBG_13_40_15 TaxID=1802593 RepID=A0A1G1W6B0_9BACT|nr:MAG: hypothetical protein A2172_02505 [Candidatus Woykebacteria bacterium RBG_13_40_15]